MTKTGRKKNFNTKIVAGLPIWEFEKAAFFGESALTAGARIVQDCFEAAQTRKHSPGSDAEAENTRAWKQVRDAMFRCDSKLFREIADFLDAWKTKIIERSGPASEAAQNAAYFVAFCGNRGVDFRYLWTLEMLRERIKSPTIEAAWKRPPFVPSVAEIWSFLCDIMESPPDLKNVYPIARALGVPVRKKRKTKRTK